MRFNKELFKIWASSKHTISIHTRRKIKFSYSIKFQAVSKCIFKASNFSSMKFRNCYEVITTEESSHHINYFRYIHKRNRRNLNAVIESTRHIQYTRSIEIFRYVQERNTAIKHILHSRCSFSRRKIYKSHITISQRISLSHITAKVSTQFRYYRFIPSNTIENPTSFKSRFNELIIFFYRINVLIVFDIFNFICGKKIKQNMTNFITKRSTNILNNIKNYFLSQTAIMEVHINTKRTLGKGYIFKRTTTLKHAISISCRRHINFRKSNQSTTVFKHMTESTDISSIQRRNSF